MKTRSLSAVLAVAADGILLNNKIIIRFGLFTAQWARKDGDLASLRKDPDFELILSGVRAR